MSEKFYTTDTKAEAWDITMPLLQAMFNEFKELQKKKPDAAVNLNKCAVVNRLLAKVREVLADDDALAFLDVVEKDDVPQVSDVSLMLSQYVAAMQAFRDRHHGWTGAENGWFIKTDKKDVRKQRSSTSS